MPKQTGLIVLILGIAVIVAALMDVFKMSHGINLDIGIKQFSEWPTERLVLLGVGVALAAFGAYGLTRKGRRRR
jgi:hypothetical protein